MPKGPHIQNLCILAFILVMTFGVWYFSEQWGGAWSVLTLYFWLSPVDREEKSHFEAGGTNEHDG
jgi:hypothetical protein